MEKSWFIIVNNLKEGPYGVADLKRHPGVNPDTLAWKEGFPNWKPIRRIPELQILFEDEREIPKPPDENAKPVVEGLSDEAALTIGQDPFYNFLWILVLILLIFYFIFRSL
ncbi:MAG: DUF4339 domain-containing protein [Parachlamydia sp.]|jgi:hypothetical protein|nr:DUF4339 domain-containing protein [Parachlamydia sp.]